MKIFLKAGFLASILLSAWANAQPAANNGHGYIHVDIVNRSQLDYLFNKFEFKSTNSRLLAGLPATAGSTTKNAFKAQKSNGEYLHTLPVGYFSYISSNGKNICSFFFNNESFSLTGDNNHTCKVTSVESSFGSIQAVVTITN